MPCWFLGEGANKDGNSEIYIMNADGSGQQRLTNNSWSDENPKWSPSGDMIAFDSNRDGNLEIYLMNADGSNQENLTVHQALDYGATWSPNGQYLAFNSDRDGATDIYILLEKDTKPVQLRMDFPVRAYHEPLWLP